MPGPWEDYQSGDTATIDADAQGPWSDFEPGVVPPVQGPERLLSESQLREPFGREGRPIPSTPEELAMQNFEIGGRRMLKPPGPIEIIPGSGLTTEREGDNIFPRVQTPPEAGALEKIAAGVVNTAGGVGNFVLSPTGVATAMVPEVAGAKLAGPVLKGLFGGLMAKSAGEMAGKASVTGDIQDWTEAGLAGAGAGLVALPGSLPPRPPPVEGPLATGEVLQMPKGSAVPPKVPFNLPDAAAPEPPVVPPKAETLAVPVEETLTPALLVGDKPISGGKSHDQVLQSNLMKVDDPIALMDAHKDDAKHVFIHQKPDGTTETLTREAAGPVYDRLWGNKPETTKSLESAMLEEPKKSASAPESIKGGAESGMSPKHKPDQEQTIAARHSRRYRRLRMQRRRLPPPRPPRRHRRRRLLRQRPLLVSRPPLTSARNPNPPRLRRERLTIGSPNSNR